MTWPDDDHPQGRRGSRFFGQWSAVVASAGTRTGRRLGKALDRRPIGLPASVLVAGVVMIVLAVVLSPGAAAPPAGEEPVAGRVVAVSLLFGLGGVVALAGTAGLVSAALVHIVKKMEMRGRTS
jgi:hypothetical protein